ncbi:MAG: MFS transporter [Chloroflexi bacterium]|nr:MAG: MFS transporter [Chloroflexota bacterium]
MPDEGLSIAPPAEPAGPARPASRWPRTLRALRHRNFRLFWSGQIASQIGTWMQIVAQGWLVYRLTDSPLMLGLVTVVGLLPVVPVSLLAGVLSDRFSRKKLIIVTEIVLMLQALILAYLTWAGIVQVWHVIVLSFVLGGAAALEQPARLAFVIETVGKEDISNAVALNSSVYNAARIVGPAAAGLLVAWMGEAGCFLINGVSYLPVILAMLAIRLPSREGSVEKLKLMGSLASGFRYTWDTQAIRSLLLIVALSSFFTLPYITLMPVFARDVLAVGPQGLGFLMTGVGAGAIGGALVVANVESGRRGRWLMLGNLLGPAFLLLFCLSQSFALSIVVVALLGASNAIRQTLANSLIQLTTAEKYHGRVMSLFNLLFNGMSRTGALGVGAVAEVTGVPLALGASAVISLVLGVAMLRGMPEVVHLA